MLAQDSLELTFDFETMKVSYADSDSRKIIFPISEDDDEFDATTAIASQGSSCIIHRVFHCLVLFELLTISHHYFFMLTILFFFQ